MPRPLHRPRRTRPGEWDLLRLQPVRPQHLMHRVSRWRDCRHPSGLAFHIVLTQDIRLVLDTPQADTMRITHLTPSHCILLPCIHIIRRPPWFLRGPTTAATARPSLFRHQELHGRCPVWDGSSHLCIQWSLRPVLDTQWQCRQIRGTMTVDRRLPPVLEAREGLTIHTNTRNTMPVEAKLAHLVGVDTTNADLPTKNTLILMITDNNTEGRYSIHYWFKSSRHRSCQSMHSTLQSRA